jgi:ubiquitin-protein ligase
VAEAAPPPAQETGQYPTLRFIVRDDEELDPAPGPLLAAAREVVGPGAQLLYTTYGQVAIEIPAAAADRLDDVAAAVQHALPPGRDIDVQFQRYDHRPHLLDLVFAEGPDHQRFELTGIPTVTTVRELANAIMDQYDEDVFRDTGTGHRRRVTVDHLPQQEGTQPRRLDPEATVHAEGIQDGDGVRLLPEVTAGAPPRQRQIAVARAGAAIRKFANDNDGFRLIAALPEDLPFNFEVELTAPGFGPPLDGEFEPVDRDVHRVVITLHSEFPIQAPYVTFLTPVFHPNIRAGGNHNGAVCLGVLLEQYTPGLDFTELCLILLDLAAYRNYETGHFLNGAAAEWARSPEGITRILARGGLALAPANATADELPEEKSSIRLAVRPLDRKP